MQLVILLWQSKIGKYLIDYYLNYREINVMNNTTKKIELSPIYDELFDDINEEYTKATIKEIQQNDFKEETEEIVEEVEDVVLDEEIELEM